MAGLQLEAPPRTTGNAQQDFPLIITWIYKLYETIIRSGYYLTLEAVKKLMIGSAASDNLLWDDLRFPAQGINPPGAVSDPSIDSTTGNLLFSGTADNVIVGVAQMPHGWKAGTPIMPHLHMQMITASVNDSRWKFEYDIANRNQNFKNAYGTYTLHNIVTVRNPENALLHKVASFGEIDMTGYTESCVMRWKITRLAASDALDNDANDIALLEFDIHYQKDKDGTQSVYRGT